MSSANVYRQGTFFTTRARSSRFRAEAFQKGETDMGDKGGKKDKGKREQQKKSKLTQKEKRKVKQEKKAKNK